jgi:hypothetical protein
MATVVAAATASGRLHLLEPPPNSMYDPMHEPSWYKLLKIKVKKTFCLQLDIQECMYDVYVAEKKSRQRQKSIMRKLELEVSPPGSE